MRKRYCWSLALLPWLLTGAALADGPQDNVADQVRSVPPVGLELSPADHDELMAGLTELDRAVAGLKKKSDAFTRTMLPDVEIFARAVRQGVKHRELYSPKDVENAKQLLAEGQSRAAALQGGEAPWLTAKGLVVRGYRSKLDQTVQPYGLVIPESYVPGGKDRYRLDLWFHGRGERSTEAVFIAERMNQVGRISPDDTIVLHPYGRYSNAFKFAGEVDVLEALEHAKRNYRVDEDRIAVRGFSMGGAGCWQMAVHYPDLFFAANPGAGFSETPEFLKSFQKETLTPTWYEEKLWQLYDCPGYSANLYTLPTIAYSGELDIQKQAADVMEQKLAQDGLRLTHIIGPETKHAIHPDSLRLIETKLASLAGKGRSQLPLEVRFATYTLKYNRSHWLTVTGLGEHWKQAKVGARLVPDKNTVLLSTSNVTGLELKIPAGHSPFAADRPVAIVLSNPSTSISELSQPPPQSVLAMKPGTDGSWAVRLHHDGKAWQLGAASEAGSASSTFPPRKQHDLQGPIDDAFMDSFIVVRPTGKARHAVVDAWANAELDHLVKEWRRQFRGDAVVKNDNELTETDIANSNLILFGDPASNAVLQSIIDRLPIQWNAENIVVGDKTYAAQDHAPVLIYPNPANPERYVVLGSGFTYREYAYLNNARQVPKLPDWAVVDLRTPPNALWPGKIVEAGFFDENWQLK